MKRILSVTFFCGTLFGNAGVFSKSGIGLYIDAAYAPGWRGCFPETPIVYKAKENNTAELGPFFEELVFRMNQSCDEYAPGLEIRADLSANRKASVQAVFYGLYGWNFNRATIENKIKIREVQYQEQFNSIEINYLKHLSPRYFDYVSISLLAGVRGIQQNNKIHLFESAHPGSEGEVTDIFAQMKLNNVNRLIGLQMGGIFRYRMSNRVYLDIPVKGAGYGNLLDYASFIGYPALNSTPPASFYLKYLSNENKTRVFAAASGEIAPRLEIHLGKMYAFIGGSYLYVYGINQAVNQIQREYVSKIQACDSFSIAGILIGGGVHF